MLVSLSRASICFRSHGHFLFPFTEIMTKSSTKTQEAANVNLDQAVGDHINDGKFNEIPTTADPVPPTLKGAKRKKLRKEGEGK